jgi:hypothetical protein
MKRRLIEAPEVRQRAAGRWTGLLAALAPALVTGADGAPVTVHRTYLTADGRKAPVAEPKKLMGYPGDGLVGGAIRLFAPGATLGVAEGIETALAVHLRTGMPVWSAVSAGCSRAWSRPRRLRWSWSGRIGIAQAPVPIPVGAKGIDWADVWCDCTERAVA